MENLEKNTALICGIDTLYYFIETNKKYENMFINIVEQIEYKKAYFESQDIEYKDTDIFININGASLQYLNKAEGFYWFKDISEFFRVGVKDNFSNAKLHNIRIQLQGIGIYSIGLKPLLSFINDEIFQDISTGLYPITRADINCFINYDFSFIDKSMFATRKKRYFSISEFGSANKIETIYVGKSPFMLRLYDKQLELSKSSKKEMMYEYFTNNGLDTKLSIFNIEFELHRTHLKAYEIKTLDDLLSNANNLFKKAMEDIRLIDKNSITDKDIKNNSKSRATTLPIWDYVKENFNIDTFMQYSAPLQRIRLKTIIYDENRFIDDLNNLMKKAMTHQLDISSEFLTIVSDELIKNENIKKQKHRDMSKYQKRYIDVHIEGESKQYRLLPDGEFISPKPITPFIQLDDFQLEREIVELESFLHFGEEEKRTEVAKKLEVAYKEKLSRGVR